MSSFNAARRLCSLNAARRLCRSRGWRFSLRLAAVMSLSGSLISGALAALPSAQASGQASLVPDGGQFVSIPIVKVLDTRSGIGTVCGCGHIPLGAGEVRDVSVAGITNPTGGIVQTGIPVGVDAVVANINAINVTASGGLEAYDTDSPDPQMPSVSLTPGVNTNQTLTIPVSSAGDVTVENQSSASVDVAMTITGYYTGATASAAGDTYAGVPWAEIADTTTGLGVPNAQIPASGSITVQAGGQGGIASGTAVAVLQVNAMNATTSGFLTVYAAGSPDPGLAALSYGTGMIYRNLFYVPLAGGQVTITNHGSVPVDVTVYARGYFMPPSASPAGGQFSSIDPDVVYDATSTPLAANTSATFQVTDNGGSTDQAGIVPQDANLVAEDVIVLAPSVKGSVSTGTPGGTMHPVINFLAGNNINVGFDDSLVTQISPSGQETITNNSSAALQVEVTAVGFYEPPTAPNPPTSVAAAISGSSATVTWAAPGSDGGSPVTGYTVTAPPSTASVTVSGTASTATLTGLSNAAGDTFTVTATNAAGTSTAGTYTPQAAVISGTVLQPSGAPLGGDVVSVYPADPPDPSLTSWTPVLLGTTTTDASGNWSFTVPPYASLPADAQAAADYDGGELNVEAEANGAVTTGGTTYPESATAFESAWTGTATPAAAPDGRPSAQAMTLYPQGPDNSDQDTTANEANTYAALHDSEITGNPADDTTAPSTDAYGFQEIGGNGTYNPFIAADGTNLAGLSVTPDTPQTCLPGPVVQIGSRWDKWVIAGEAHAWWDVAGSFKYGHDGKTTEGVVVSTNFGADWVPDGSATFTDSTDVGWSDTMSLPDHDAHRFKLHLWFHKLKQQIVCGSITRTLYSIEEHGLDNQAGSGGPDKWSSYKLNGEDGRSAFLASNPAYRNWIHLTDNRCILGVYSRDYKAGVTLAGIGVFTESTYNTNTSQCIQAGHKHWRHHWEWGRQGKYTDRLARTLYSW